MKYLARLEQILSMDSIKCPKIWKNISGGTLTSRGSFSSCCWACKALLARSSATLSCILICTMSGQGWGGVRIGDGERGDVVRVGSGYWNEMLKWICGEEESNLKLRLLCFSVKTRVILRWIKKLEVAYLFVCCRSWTLETRLRAG